MNRNFIFTDGSTLAVGTFYGIGSNYGKHAKEMGGEVPAEPVVFIKPPAAYLPDGGTIRLPGISDNVHHEVELVVVIGKDCSAVSASEANDYIAGYAVGIDVTLRDVQAKAKSEGKPWAVAKGFATSAPVSMVVPIDQVHSSGGFEICLTVNGSLRQKCSTAIMERPVEVLIEYLSKIFTLRAGDAIFTGTPEGVGRIVKGDRLVAELLGYTRLEVGVE